MSSRAQSSPAMMRIAQAIIRLRYFVVVFWIAVAVALSLLLPDVEQANTGSLGDLVANDADAIETEERSVELFGLPLLSRTIVVEVAPGGLSEEELSAIFERAADLGLGELPGLESIALALPVTDDLLANSERTEAALTYLFFPPDIGPVGRTGLAERLLERHVEAPGRSTGITGAVPARGEQIRAIGDALPWVELATVLLITLAVGLHFRSLIAPLANIFTVALAYLVSLRLIGGAGQAIGISVPEEVEPVMVALLFGTVTDYTIFFVSRFRSHLASSPDARRAAEVTTAELMPVIFVAGISVAAASASLVVAQLGFFQAFGPGLAVAVMIALAVVLTLVPALLAVAGEALFWPGANRRGWQRLRALRRGERRAEAGARRHRLTGWLGALPTRRPLLVAVVTAIPLALLSLGVLRLELGNTVISGLPDDAPAKQAYRLAGSEFPTGAISPLMILVEAPGITERRQELLELERALAGRRGFSEVVGPGRLNTPVELGAVKSPTGDAIRYLVVLDLDPFGSRAIDAVTELREQLPRMLIEAGLPDAEASLAGDTAISEETVVETEEDLGRIIPVASLVVLVVLIAFLRALIGPLYLVASSLLALGAALGLTVLVFQDLLAFGQLTFYVPFAGTVLLIALGSDYNVYLVGRVWAEAKRRPFRQAVAVAGARAASAITVAGIVLAASFALLALVPLRPFRELAFLLSAGLLIDAFVVRSFLAPALITLVGERSAWPGRGLRRDPGPPPAAGVDAAAPLPPAPLAPPPAAAAELPPPTEKGRRRDRLPASAGPIVGLLAAAAAGALAWLRRSRR